MRKGSQSESHSICQEETELDLDGSVSLLARLHLTSHCCQTPWVTGASTVPAQCSTTVTTGRAKGKLCHLMDTPGGGPFALLRTWRGLGKHAWGGDENPTRREKVIDLGPSQGHTERDILCRATTRKELSKKKRTCNRDLKLAVVYQAR